MTTRKINEEAPLCSKIWIFHYGKICLQMFLKRASNSLFCQLCTHTCNSFRKNRNFLIPWYKGWVIMSQFPYSGGLQDLHGNGKFLSLFLAPTSNLPARLPHTETMPEPATCRCTPRCLNPKVRVLHWIQPWGWISGLQPFLAFNASAPLQKLKLTWKTLYVPVLLHHLSGCTICYTAGCSCIRRARSIPHPSHGLQRMQWARGRHEWMDYH